MKVWLHILAAIVGLSLAALIVFVVFGSASEEGAAQEGDAPASEVAASGGCGSVPPAEGGSEAARRTALEALPSIIDPTGREVTPTRDDQRAWFAAVHAAAGLCVDEVHITDESTTIAISTVDGVSDTDAAAYAGAALAAANQAPLGRPLTILNVLVGDEQRSARVSRRAWTAFSSQRRQMGLGTSMSDLVTFRRRVSFSPQDLSLSGWA